MENLVLLILQGILIILAILVILFVALYIYTSWNHMYFKRMGIPGPEPKFFGIMQEFKNKSIGQVDLELHQKYGKICGYFECNLKQLSVADPEFIKEICVKQFSKFSDKVVPLPCDKYERRILSVLDTDKWRHSRTILSPTFSSAKLKEMSFIIQKCADLSMEKLKKYANTEKSVDFRQITSALFLDIACNVGFGVEVNSEQESDHPLVQAVSDSLFLNYSSLFFAVCYIFPPIVGLLNFLGIGFMDRQAKSTLASAITEFSKERENSNVKRKDYLQMLIEAGKDEKKKGGEFNELDLWGGAASFIIAGTESTHSTCSYVFYFLAIYPEIQERVVNEIANELEMDEEPTFETLGKLKYLTMVIEETSRLYPSFLRTFRRCREDTEVLGIKIKKGLGICLPIYAINRDPDFWPNPEEFDPERFSPENKAKRSQYCFASFGAGPRNCLGMRLAFLAVGTCVVNVLKKYRVEAGPELQKPMVDIVPSIPIAKPKQGIWLRLVDR